LQGGILRQLYLERVLKKHPKNLVGFPGNINELYKKQIKWPTKSLGSLFFPMAKHWAKLATNYFLEL
jgi:hypothetical protein